MRANRPLSFDGLESRQLLTTAHSLGSPSLAGGEVHAMVSSLPIDLSGTLAVNTRGKQVAYDNMGGTAESLPIRGSLQGVGTVRGYWVETQGANGTINGPDELHLQNAKGTLTVSFRNPLATNAAAQVKAQSHSSTSNNEPRISTISAAQKVTGGAKVYNHATESGTVTLSIGDSGRSIRSLVLATGAGIEAS